VLVAGDPEDRARAERERSGIPIEPALWGTLCALSEDLGVPVPRAVTE
jgi:LDH2 family malate/lactate/ureidoglycolate dehydrogenase